MNETEIIENIKGLAFALTEMIRSKDFETTKEKSELAQKHFEYLLLAEKQHGNYQSFITALPFCKDLAAKRNENDEIGVLLSFISFPNQTAEHFEKYLKFVFPPRPKE